MSSISLSLSLSLSLCLSLSLSVSLSVYVCVCVCVCVCVGHRLRSVVTRLKEENPDHLLDIGTNQVRQHAFSVLLNNHKPVSAFFQLLRLAEKVRDGLRKVVGNMTFSECLFGN